MDTIKRDFEKHKKPLLIGLITIIFFGLLLFKDWDKNSNLAPITGGDKTIVGKFTCLPTEGFSFGGDDCLLGVLGDDGYNYALDTSSVKERARTLGAEDKIEVSGMVVPIAELSGEMYKGYEVAGVIKVVSLKKY